MSNIQFRPFDSDKHAAQRLTSNHCDACDSEIERGSRGVLSGEDTGLCPKCAAIANGCAVSENYEPGAAPPRHVSFGTILGSDGEDGNYRTMPARGSDDS